MRVVRAMRRILLPRRPGRDTSVTQDCIFYASLEHDAPATCLVLTPLLGPDQTLPYYHPRVRHIAFRLFESTLRIEAVPLPDTPPLTLESRLYRTCLSLLDTAQRYLWGQTIHWQKRVRHDLLVPRDAYQDLYLVMRERHKHLAQDWKEETDPLKHVFEEIGIAVYLMLLWKTAYAADDDTNRRRAVAVPGEPWKLWPRPPGGFLDLGCGAGMLTHVLVAEGYEGIGLDVRARKSWEHYPAATRDCLRVHTLNPTHVLSRTWESASYFQPGVFLVGNHADELTPWMPVLSALTPGSAYFSLPCCTFTLDTRFERDHPPDLPEAGSQLDLGQLCMPASESNMPSSYEAYRIWLGRLSLVCGWKIECDNLRIPSTRNWAIIGRERTNTPPSEVRRVVRELVQETVDRGVFTARGSRGG
ncbi:DUF1613-domain-containing protein [Auricularia subglabra TFB-10046 SS5]|nr:DUF1613-domain-containing protein [Auricularia subglabra TFB-10046 SS5]